MLKRLLFAVISMSIIAISAWGACHANSVRKILEEEGVSTASFFMVAGRADTQPLFPDDPSLAANRRVTITLMREDPPLPPNLKP